MNGYQAYKYFMAVKLHFTTDKYDLFEKRGRVSGTQATFEKRNDRGLFEKLADRFDTDQQLIQFLVANLAYGNKNVIYSQESDDYYMTWMRRKESRSRVFEIDLLKIFKHVTSGKLKESSLYSIENEVPELLKLYVGGHVTLESMVMLQELEDYLPTWEPLIMLWHDHFLTIRKCKRFVQWDTARVQSIYQQHKENMSEL